MSRRSSPDKVTEDPIFLSFRREVGEIDTEFASCCRRDLGGGTICHLTEEDNLFTIWEFLMDRWSRLFLYISHAHESEDDIPHIVHPHR